MFKNKVVLEIAGALVSSLDFSRCGCRLGNRDLGTKDRIKAGGLLWIRVAGLAGRSSRLKSGGDLCVIN